MLHLWYSPVYTEGLSPEARFPRERYRFVRSLLEEVRRRGEVFFHEPSPIKEEELLLVHCPDYTKRFLTEQLEDRAVRRIGLRPWTDLIVERTRILTNGTVMATRKVLEDGGISGNVGGGTHHAYTSFGSGYCIFNDLAIAARMAQRDYGIGRVLIVDLDVHQGDGTASIFRDDPTVRTVSFHCEANFPFRKMQSDHDEVFEKGTPDQPYLDALQRFLEVEIERAPVPGLILYQAGVDSLATDRLGFLSLTREGLLRRNQMVFEFARNLDCPLAVTMGGGYGEPLESSCQSHFDLFEAAAKIGSGR